MDSRGGADTFSGNKKPACALLSQRTTYEETISDATAVPLFLATNQSLSFRHITLPPDAHTVIPRVCSRVHFASSAHTTGFQPTTGPL